MLVYVPIGAHTLARVRSQIKLAERKTRSEDTFYLFHPPLQRSGSNDGTPAFSSPAARNVPRWSADTRVDPPGSPALDKTNRPKALSDASLRPASQKHSGDAGAVSSVFPPVNRAAEEAETQHMPAARRRVFNLKRIFNNVSVQYGE